MFYLESYDGLPLPLIEARQTISSGRSVSPYRRLPGGGAVRVRGTEPAPRDISRITSNGELGSPEDDIAAICEALYAKRGIGLRKLWRRVRGTSESHWCWAELLEVGAENTVDTVFTQPLACEFLMASPSWYGQIHGLPDPLWGSVTWGGFTWGTPAGYSIPLAPGVAVTTPFPVINGGNYRVDDAILTILAGASDLTGVTFIGVTGETSLSFNAVIPAGQSLVLDAGRRSVKLNGVAAYDDLHREAAHLLGGWLRLAANATTTIEIVHNNAAAGTASIAFSEAHE